MPEFDPTATPAEPFADAKRRVAHAVDANRAELLDLSHRIHANPEPAYEEHKAAAWVAESLRAHGFVVEAPAGRLATAIRARMPGGRGVTGPKIGIMAEYDALPGLGHGCGHNSMAASGVGAAIALAALAPELDGEIVFLGCPAEERGSGKQQMIEDGLFDGLDAALLYHPCTRNHVACQTLASEDIEVLYTGKQAHAASDPWEGLNALDALILLFNGVALWRQQLRPSSRVHGIVQEGGTAANIIPDRAKAWFMIRSDDRAYYETMRTRFVEIAEGAAKQAGVEVEIAISGGSTTMNENTTLAGLWMANALAYGVADDGPDPTFGSTDVTNVSWVVPTIHPDLSIAPDGIPGHSIAFRDAAITPLADATTLLAATLVAQTAYELFADPSLVEAAWREFRASAQPA
jgi:amidohydrolase